jgi:hypothetical protein
MRTPLLWTVLASAVTALLTGPGFVPVASAQNEGFLYGRITMRSGSEYTGILRWGREESFWDDLFDSMKEDRPFLDDDFEEYGGGRRRDRDDRGSGGRIRILGKSFTWGDDDGWSSSRWFTARFGDIESITVTGDEEADILMKSGTVFAVSGYANDVGGEILVRDDSLGEVDLKWDRIDRIDFLPTPAGAKAPARRLQGRVFTEGGEFHGFVQWDSEECLTTDELDGESEDGDMSIAFENIRAIERRGRRSSEVELKDGRSLRLRGTNDVNQDIRGIFVEDERVGRVKISWDEFDRVEFEDLDATGRGYDDYRPSVPLEGTVTTVDGTDLDGRIIFDLDESETWEILNGSDGGIEYYVPFDRIESVEPAGRDESVIVLRSGETLRLEDTQDVSDRNDGLLVYASEHEPATHVPWDEVERIVFRR